MRSSIQVEGRRIEGTVLTHCKISRWRASGESVHEVANRILPSREKMTTIALTSRDAAVITVKKMRFCRVNQVIPSGMIFAAGEERRCLRDECSTGHLWAHKTETICLRAESNIYEEWCWFDQVD